MQAKQDGQTYAPKGKAHSVCEPGEFPVGVIGMDHGHIYGMCGGLSEAGADIALIWDSDAAKAAALHAKFPNAKIAKSKEQVLEDPSIKLIATASIPDQRGEVGIAAMRRGKDCFVDKPPLVNHEQLARVREAVAETGRKFGVYYSERLHVEAAVHAGELIAQGAIGKVIQVTVLAPHRLNAPSRPAWFWDKKRYGGIITDIGSHQIEQILYFTGAKNAKVTQARVANYANQGHPGFEDFGDATLLCDNGACGYFRVDWFTPAGLGAWGDGRAVIIGTEGYMEIRKYINPAADGDGDHIILVDGQGERHIKAAGTCGFPFFGQFIRDCLDGTDNAMGQEHALCAIELAIEAQALAHKSAPGGFSG
ncbi:MAG: Gfo/Idh/MocA family oxidoreductase [Spirochaetes bacterium]|nr:Gfo/Idh/MocA family oxidoreductase [Spirochaetota bacterium]